MWNLNTRSWFAAEAGDYIVYRITNTINNYSYIGKTCDLDRRLMEHRSVKNSVSLITRSIDKYGVEHFIIEVLEVCNKLTVDEAEKKWINLFSTLAPFGYNLKSGGEGGRQHVDSINKTKETKKRLFSNAEYKKKVLENTIEASRMPVLCVTTGEYFHSQEAAAERYGVSRASICNYVAGKTSKSDGLIFVDGGKFKTPDEAIISEDYCLKLNKLNAPKAHHAQRRTIHLPSLTVYPSASQASKIIGMPLHMIERCLAAKYANTTGHAFAYLNEKQTALEFAQSDECKKLLQSIVDRDLRISVGDAVYESCEHACRCLSIPPTHFRRCLDTNKQYKGTLYTKIKGQDSLETYLNSLKQLDNLQTK